MNELRGFYRIKTTRGNRIGRFLRTTPRGIHMFRAVDDKQNSNDIEIIMAMDGDKLTPMQENRKYGDWEEVPSRFGVKS